MSRAVLRPLRYTVPAAADPRLAQESQSLHALIRAGSSGRGDQKHLGHVRRHPRLHVTGGTDEPRGSGGAAQSFLRDCHQGDLSLRRHAGQARRR